MLAATFAAVIGLLSYSYLSVIGAVSSDIAVVCVPLPPNIQAKVDSVVRAASREVTPAAAAAAIATEVETQLQSPDPTL